MNEVHAHNLHESQHRVSKQTVVVLTTFFFIVIAGCFAFFWRLGASAINHIDESTHAVVTREMRESGDWLNLTIRGVPYDRKPPLSFWIRAVVQNAFGENEFTHRLPSALAGVGTLLLIALWAWQWTRNIAVVVASSAIFLLTPMNFVHTFRQGEADGLLIFFSTLSAYLFWKSVRRPYLLSPAMLAVALTFMVKSAAAIVMPVTFLLALFVVHTWPYRWRDVWIGCALFFLIVLPWHAQQLVAHGRAFWDEYFGFHIVDRITTRLHTSPKAHGFFWYFSDMKKYFFPWTWLLPAGIAYSGRHIFRRDTPITETFLLTWSVGTVFVYTLVATKLEWYIAPAFPAFALLLGYGMVKAFSTPPQWLRWLILAGYAGFLAQAIPQYRTGNAGRLMFAWFPGTIVFGTAIIVGCIAIGFAYWRGRQQGERIMTILVALALIHMTLMSGIVFSQKMQQTDENYFRVFGTSLNKAGTNKTVYIDENVVWNNPLTAYYLQGAHHARTVVPLNEDKVFRAQTLQTQDGAFIVLRNGTVQENEQSFLKTDTIFGDFTLYRIAAPTPTDNDKI